MESLAVFLTLDRCLEITGFLIGLLYLYWEYHADPKMWIANILMPTISFWVYYRGGLYADFGMNIYYFLIAIYGYIAWTRHGRKARGSDDDTGKAGLPITHIGPRQLAGCTLAFAAVYAAIAWWLVACTDSTVPYWDAFTTALSIIATWMLARKYIEHWIAWTLVDGVCVWLYIFKDRPFYAVLYAIYTVIAVLGYRKWLRLMHASTRNVSI